MGLLKLIVCFCTLLIGTEGARPSKKHSHFIRAVLSQRCLQKILREERVKVTAGARERSIGRPRFAELLERKSADKFNRA
jgi:hypothetical protein